MAAERKKSKVPGVRYREHATRKNGVQKDKYFFIYYSANKKQKEEGVGWASEGWTEKKAAVLLFEIKENIRKGIHPQSLAEMRAMNEEAAKKQEAEQNKEVAKKITLQEVFDKYIEVHRQETSGNTWKVTRGYYQNWIKEPLGNRALEDITVDDIQGVVSKAYATRAPRTADYVKVVLRQIFNFAKKRDLYFKDNPAMKVKIKLTDNKRERFLTEEEARRLLDALKNRKPDLHDMVILSAFSGLRLGEICNLQWNDINWGTEHIFVSKPKNGQSRMEPIHPIVKDMLTQRYAARKTGYIFQKENGEKINNLSKIYKKVIEELGFNNGITDPRQKVVFHTLRHTYASWLVMNGVDLYTTQKLMGHKTASMTQRYAHLAPGYLKDAVNTLKGI